MTVDRSILFDLLQKSTSLGVVSDFLKRKGLPFSAGSWEDMFALRLHPYMDESKLTERELTDLLGLAEEYGRQHIFLLKTTPENARSIMDRVKITKTLKSMKLEGLLTAPKLYDFPKHPTISDVRWVTSSSGTDQELIIKEIQAREFFRLVGTKPTAKGIIKEYDKEQERGVNLIRLHRNGQMEVRVAARTGSTRYGIDASEFRTRLRALIPVDGFAEISLNKAKTTLWQDRSKYAGKIRFSEVAARNDDDFILKAAGGRLDANVSSNAASVASMEKFIEQKGRCESYNLWFSKEHTPSKREIHFFMSGEANEFAINANCTKEDYEYVLTEIRSLNT